MTSSPRKLGVQRRPGLDIGDAIHQGRSSGVVDVPFTGEAAASLRERGGLGVVLVGFGSCGVEGADQAGKTVVSFDLSIGLRGAGV